MSYKKAIKLLHDCLIFNHGNIKEPIEKQLANLESKRGKIHESHRKELEKTIGINKEIIKTIENQELRLRELFNYLEYADIEKRKVKELEIKLEELKRSI